MGLHAAEQLVAELAASRVGKDMKNTEEQRDLNIPSFLVYLLGIVIAEDEYHRSNDHKSIPSNVKGSRHCVSVREKRFFDFQKMYFALTKNVYSESKPYKLTTRIVPSKDQQAIVNRDLLKQCEKLESASNEALQFLLMEESLSSSQHTVKKNKRRIKKGKKQKSRRHPITEINENVISDPDINGEKRMGTCNMNEVTSATLHFSPDNSVDGNVREGGRYPSSNLVSDDIHMSTATRFTSPMHLETDSGSNMKLNKEILLQIECIGDFPVSSDDVADNSDEEDFSSEGSRVQNTEPFAINLPQLSSTPPNNLQSVTCPSDDVDLRNSANEAFAPTKQSQRLNDLEKDLVEIRQQLIDERLAHTKALRKEKERYENLIQALQLRLYISENKLRNYEEALETHVHAVSLINSSRYTTRGKTRNEERRPGPSSLISKVLENQSDENPRDGVW